MNITQEGDELDKWIKSLYTSTLADKIKPREAPFEKLNKTKPIYEHKNRSNKSKRK